VAVRKKLEALDSENLGPNTEQENALPELAPPKSVALSAIERVERSFEMVQVIRDANIKSLVLAKPSGSRVWELFLASVEKEIISLQTNEQTFEDVGELNKMLDHMASVISSTHDATHKHLLMFTQTVQGALGKVAQNSQAPQRPQQRQQAASGSSEIPNDILNSILSGPSLNL